MQKNINYKSNKPKWDRGRNGAVPFLRLFMILIMVSIGCALAGCADEGDLIQLDENVVETEEGDEEYANSTEDIYGTEVTEVDIIDESNSHESGYVAEKENEEGTDTGNSVKESADTVCYVYVCGAVMHPDVYELDESRHIVDAIEAAGGFSDEAAKDYINLARKVEDGVKIYVPTKEEAAAMNTDLSESENLIADCENESTKKDSSSSMLININTADKTSLMTLPGIGEAKAEKIILYRENNGQFTTISDIMNVDGIKTAAFEKIKDLICVD